MYRNLHAALAHLIDTRYRYQVEPEPKSERDLQMYWSAFDHRRHFAIAATYRLMPLIHEALRRFDLQRADLLAEMVYADIVPRLKARDERMPALEDWDTEKLIDKLPDKFHTGRRRRYASQVLDEVFGEARKAAAELGRVCLDLIEDFLMARGSDPEVLREICTARYRLRIERQPPDDWHFDDFLNDEPPCALHQLERMGAERLAAYSLAFSLFRLDDDNDPVIDEGEPLYVRSVEVGFWDEGETRFQGRLRELLRNFITEARDDLGLEKTPRHPVTLPMAA
jgi:hypothetical protein